MIRAISIQWHKMKIFFSTQKVKVASNKCIFSLSRCPSKCEPPCMGLSPKNCYDYSGPGGGGSGGSLHIRGQFVHVGKLTKFVA